MKETIFRYARSIRVRIISAFLAFLIFALTFQQAFVGWEVGMRVSAAGDGNIHSATTEKTSIYTSDMNTRKAVTGNSAYTYTGKYTNDNTITMFDYVSDYELSGTYNNCQQDESGYTDVYHALNNAISNSRLISASSSNVTIEFQAQYRTASEAPKVQVNYYDSSSHGSGFQNMKLVSKSSSKEDNTTYNHFIYRFTVKKNQTIGNMTLSSNSITGLTFRINDDVSSLKNHNTGDEKYSINSSDCAGKKYVFHHYNNGSDTGHYFPDNTTGTADAIYSSDYSIPFYFGNFWLGNEATAYGNDIKPVYNNFYWRANMGLKPYNTKGSASTQKLVGNNLSGPDDNDAKGNLLDVNYCTYNATPALNNEVELPYFSKTWAENNKTSDNKPLIRYYDEDVVGGNITFPFYEVYKEHNSTGRYERYYQFDSREANLKFNIQNTNDINNHKGYFSESGTDIVRHWWDGDTYIDYTKGDRSNVGFFPFNENNNGESGNTNAHNLGFGMKMEMDFQLEADGCVKVMNKDSNDKLTDIEGDGVQRVPTIFEFTGDDDLWVFIDGNLVLDMGGDHFKSHGKIDFYNKTATVDSAIDFGTGTARDDLGADPTAAYVNSSSSPTFLSLLSGHNFDSTNPDKYDTTTTHTLTVFYMERGMMDSNLLIRFNYSPIPNNSRMKIAEVTKFDNVNEGLKPATKRAAEGDVFKYTVTNKLPSDILQVAIETPLSSGAKYPELGSYTRTAEGNSSWTTALTPNGTGTAEDKLFVNGVPGVETYVKDTAYWWVDGFSNGSWLVGKTTPQSGSDNGGDLWLMYGTADILYGDSKRGVESSAEFEKQFTRNSTMKVVQGDNLYRLPARDVNGHTTLFNDSGQLQAVEQTGTGDTQSRTVSDYYSTNYRLIDRNNNDLTSSNDLNNTKTFSFNNDTSVNDSFAVMLTEFVENTVKVGAITIKKQKPNDDSIPSDKEFTIKVRFEDIFGVEEVDADNETDYTGIKYKVYDSSGTLVNGDGTMTSGTVKVTEGGNEVEKYCGTFKLKVGQTATIEGIPYKTKYIVYENEPKYAPTYDNNNSTVLVGTIDDSSHKAVPLNSTTPNNNNITVTNFSHSLTIKEVTDFSTVNAGLISYTKTAAEKDVFKYTVKNSSTVDGINSGIPTPIYDTYTRQANGATTAVKFSGQPVQYVQVDDTEHVYLDISKFTSWNDHNPVFAAWLYESSDSTKSDVAKEFTLVSDNLYRLDPEDYTKIIILRLDSFIKTDRNENWLSYVWEKRTDNNKKYWWGRIDVGTLIKGYTYQVTDWNTTEPGNTFDTLTTPQKLNTSTVIYNYNNFVYDSSDTNHYVKNVNYEWVDEFAAKTSGTTNDLLAGTTDETGSFYLMHGTTAYAKNSVTYTQDKESSATFYNQFARGSTMTVEQDGTLTSPNGGTPDTLQDNNQRGAGTSLGDYYTKTKTLEGSSDDAPDDNDTFEYNNTTRDTGKSIRITETFTNTVKTGSITISKKVSGDESYNDTFQFRIILTDVFGVTGNNVEDNGYGEITITNAFNANGTTVGKLAADGTFYVKQGTDAVISGIPVETTYQIVETTKSGWSASYKIGDSGSFNSGASTPASGNKISSNGITVSFINTPPAPSTNEIILTKTAKEQVGTKAVGAELTGAAFKLVKIESPNNNDDLRFNYDSTDTTTNKYTYAATGGTYNQSGNWLTTGSDGKLHIKGLPVGDYYLEEQTAPAGFVATDSNNVVNGTAQNKRVYFSIGDNTTTKYLTCADEMAPAYIKLYEHINEKLPAWGDPTFIFKITQTKYANDTDVPAANQRTHIVALTVNDDGKITDTIKWYENGTAQNFTADPINSDYTSWLVEGSTEAEYKGMYHIDSQGRIRVEPGTYSITRVPVSRYEFVTSGHIVYATGTEPTGTYTVNSNSTETAETVTLTDGQTGDIHYYDKVAYYDKFSHVDTKINQFYKLVNGENKTVKGIRIKDINGVQTSADTTVEITTNENFKLYFIYVDGTESEINDSAEKAKLNITYSGSDSAFSNASTGFSFPNNTITIKANTDFKNKVYTLNATYDNKFTTTFDLVFERTS